MDEIKEILCTCKSCKYTFLFTGSSIPKRCPDCGAMQYITRPAVRKATKAETTAYWRVQEELKAEFGA